MSATQVWNEIILKAQEHDVEIHTRPLNKRSPLWFRVGLSGNALVISKALVRQPSVDLAMDRTITRKDFEFVYSYYDRWINGEVGIRDEVRRKSQNTTYIFALIAETSL